MKRTLQRYGIHLAAVTVIIALGLGITGGILSKQRFYLPNWVPVIGSDFVDYTIDFRTAKAVVPGQGQTVAISGVTVGEIGRVELVNGRGRVNVKIRRRYVGRIHTDASAALRPRTPLQDMIIQLDPGTKSAPVLQAGGNIPAARTMTPTEFDEFISTFDGDTRAYLAILLREGAKGLDGEGGKALGGVLRQFEPTSVYTNRIAKALKGNKQQIARTVTNLERVSAALAQNDQALATFVSSSADAFQAVGESRADLAGVVQKSPGALESIDALLKSTGSLSKDLGSAATALQRPTVKLDAGLKKLITFMDTSTPIIRDDLRPFARDVQPTLTKLKPGVDDLASSSKSVATGAEVLRQFFDGFAYEPKGSDFSALTLAGYLGHATLSLSSLQDGAGAVTRAVILSDCGLIRSGLGSVRALSPSARVLADLVGLPTTTTALPSGKTLAEYCTATGRLG